MGDSEATGKDAKAPNQYKQAVRAAQPSAERRGDRMRSALEGMISAMDAGAWQSQKAFAFADELGNRVEPLRRADDAIGEDFHATWSPEPDEVEANDWRAHWYQTSRHIPQGY